MDATGMPNEKQVEIGKIIQMVAFLSSSSIISVIVL